MDASPIDIARDWVTSAERIVVLTGAGISTDSGIPDFRGPKGLWTTNPKAEKMSSLQHYLADPEVRQLAWQSRLDSPAWSARPNSGHAAVAGLERTGHLHAVITQNVDGLHQIAGNSPERVIEVHGTMRWAICWACAKRWPMPEILDRVRAGELDPDCEVCGGIIKSDTISFGQNLVPEVIDRAFRVSAECDLMLAIGSTLQVFPVAGCVPAATKAGARVVIVNGDPTGMDDVADLVLRGSIGEILPAICGAPEA
jgi:NAD-dependent deacetylase